jgi:phage FluMu gp28-like protein
MEATESNDAGCLPRGLLIGIDFGRKRDLTVCWSLERQGDELWTKEVLTLDNISTPEQMERLRPRLALAERVCLDYTGPGIGLGDYLVQEFGLYRPGDESSGKIELCHFTQNFKDEIFPRLKTDMERGRVKIPASPAIREDLHSLQRVLSANGELSYRAPRNKDGHSDRATALALAVRAGTLSPRQDYWVETIRLPNKSRGFTEFSNHLKSARSSG